MGRSRKPREQRAIEHMVDLSPEAANQSDSLAAYWGERPPSRLHVDLQFVASALNFALEAQELSRTLIERKTLSDFPALEWGILNSLEIASVVQICNLCEQPKSPKGEHITIRGVIAQLPPSEQAECENLFTKVKADYAILDNYRNRVIAHSDRAQDGGPVAVTRPTPQVIQRVSNAMERALQIAAKHHRVCLELLGGDLEEEIEVLKGRLKQSNQ